MNRKESDKTEREHISLQDFQDALKSILLKPMEKQFHWENWEPTMRELTVGFKLKRRK